MTDFTKYPRTVFYSDEDEGYIAIAPDLPGSSAFGETAEAALAELQSAMQAWIRAATAAGNRIPEPSRPDAAQAYSGKVLVRMPKTLHRNLAERARLEGVSLNTQVVMDLTAAEAARSTSTVAPTRVVLATCQKVVLPWPRGLSQVPSAQSGTDRAIWPAVPRTTKQRVELHG